MLKEQIKESNGQLAEQPVRWRNVYFTTKGVIYGDRLFATKHEAAEVPYRWTPPLPDAIRRWKDTGIDTRVFSRSGISMLISTYQWHMQIPVVEGA